MQIISTANFQACREVESNRIFEFAVNQLSLSEIVGGYAIENPKSGNVMKKLGFKHEKGISYECNNGTVVRKGVQCRLIIEK